MRKTRMVCRPTLEREDSLTRDEQRKTIMETTTPKMKLILTTSLAEVLTIIDMLLLTTRSLVGPMKNSRHGVHVCSSVSHWDTNI